MITRKIFGCLIALLVLGLVISSCSNNSSLVTTPWGGDLPSSNVTWFPTNPGFSATFETHGADGSSRIITYKIGNAVTLGAGTAREWYVSENGSVQDTDYVVVSPTAVRVYESQFGSAEQILKLPVAVGATWARFGTLVRDTVSIITGGIDTDTVFREEHYTKIFPTEGSNEMRVARFDQLTLANGSHYSGTAEITNTNPGGTTNHYWFAPGFGLVKYVLGATELRPDGAASGELVLFAK